MTPLAIYDEIGGFLGNSRNKIRMPQILNINIIGDHSGGINVKAATSRYLSGNDARLSNNGQIYLSYILLCTHLPYFTLWYKITFQP